MRVILGIGNTGVRYEGTRHNVGFTILDLLAKKRNLKFHPSKGDYYYTGSSIKASPFILIKPTTFVNLSGVAAKQVIEEHNINPGNLLVVSDDVNLPLGEIRVRNSGGDGGHNGLTSIIYHINSNQFPRLRFGIGNDFINGLMADFVLSKFSEDELGIIGDAVENSVQLIEKFIENGMESMLSYFSRIKNKSNNNPTDKEG